MTKPTFTSFIHGYPHHKPWLTLNHWHSHASAVQLTITQLIPHPAITHWHPNPLPWGTLLWHPTDFPLNGFLKKGSQTSNCLTSVHLPWAPDMYKKGQGEPGAQRNNSSFLSAFKELRWLETEQQSESVQVVSSIMVHTAPGLGWAGEQKTPQEMTTSALGRRAGAFQKVSVGWGHNTGTGKRGLEAMRGCSLFEGWY